MENIFVRTRKLTMTQIHEVERWIKSNATGPVWIRNAHYSQYIQQYCAEHDGNRRVHHLKVHFSNLTDANHFLLDWG
jgi:hypothetical protein